MVSTYLAIDFKIFILSLQLVLFRDRLCALPSFGGRVPVTRRFAGRIFSLDSRTLNKISIAAALCLPTSQAIGTGNKIDWNLIKILITTTL
jgi:hypothetical protein